MPTAKQYPVQVYLDSKDISYLSDSDKLASDASLLRTRDELVGLARDGTAEFRFSFFNIIELAPLAPEHKPHALQRAKFVKELCGKRAYMDPDRLRRFEALSLIENGEPETSRGHDARAYVTDADWLPHSALSAADAVLGSLIQGLHNTIAKDIAKELEGLGPMQRAIKEQQLFDGRRVTKAAANKVASRADALLGKMPKKYPLTRRFWEDRMLFRYLQGKVSFDRLKQEFLYGFADVENFIEWCVDIPSIQDVVQNLRNTQASKLFDDLRNEADEHIQFAEQMLTIMNVGAKEREQFLRTLREDLQAATTPDIDNSRRDLLAELYDTNHLWFGTRGVTKEQFESKVIASALGAVPSADVVFFGAAAHFKKLALLSKNHPKLKRSDLADLIHCSFVPYADVFSVDSRTRVLIAEGAALSDTLLVEDTKALPDAIRSKAQSGGKAPDTGS